MPEDPANGFRPDTRHRLPDTGRYRSLEQNEFVVRGEDNAYRAGPRLMQIGARALSDNQLLFALVPR